MERPWRHGAAAATEGRVEAVGEARLVGRRGSAGAHREYPLGVFLFLLCIVLRAGGFGFTEHPGKPRRPRAPSIWYLPIVRALAQHPAANLFEFERGLLGQQSAKPTIVLAFRLPTLGLRLKLNSMEDYVRPPAAIGRGDEGEWRTSPLKEYPSAMCLSIAQAIGDSMAGRMVVETSERVEDCAAEALLQYVQAWDPYEPQASLGDDYVPTEIPHAPIEWHKVAGVVGEQQQQTATTTNNNKPHNN